MVTTQFLGRLGNSFFQIAAAIGYAKKYGYKWGVPSNPGESSILKHFPNLPKCDMYPKRYRESDTDEINWFNYHEIPDRGPDVTLFGFFQSWKYFDHCKYAVKGTFALNDYPEYRNYVSVHVRRGDYVQHADSFPPITEEYVFQAWRELSSAEYFTPMFFSDDIEWCKRVFELPFPDAVYSEGQNEFEDLSRMASCSHHIIANSTFSWWSAYLGHNPDKIVISPSCERGNWFGFGNGIKHDVVDLLPPEWIQIKFR